MCLTCVCECFDLCMLMFLVLRWEIESTRRSSLCTELARQTALARSVFPFLLRPLIYSCMKGYLLAHSQIMLTG